MTEKNTATETGNAGFTDAEKAAMKARAAELKKEKSRKKKGSKADGEKDVVDALSQMPEPDRTIGERLHAIIKETAPDLTPRLWYGMPAYARNGKVLCHYQAAAKFNTRCGTLGFSDEANLDDGGLWPVAFGLRELSADDEARIAALVKQAIS